MTDFDSPEQITGEDADELSEFSIGEALAILVKEFPDVSISKIRFLESRGLITPERAASGYRKFDEGDVQRLRWILTMQRDQFLPLRVIKERLDSGVSLDIAKQEVPQTTPTDSAAQEPAGSATSGFDSPADLAGYSSGARFRAAAAKSDALDREGFLRRSGLSEAQLADLIDNGLVHRLSPDGDERFALEELNIARAAKGFFAHGLSARHLKAWRIAAEREVGLMEQVISPVVHQRNTDSMQQACQIANELIDLGGQVREAVLVRALRSSLGLISD